MWSYPHNDPYRTDTSRHPSRALFPWRKSPLRGCSNQHPDSALSCTWPSVAHSECCAIFSGSCFDRTRGVETFGLRKLTTCHRTTSPTDARVFGFCGERLRGLCSSRREVSTCRKDLEVMIKLLHSNHSICFLCATVLLSMLVT